jgi:TonB family protein
MAGWESIASAVGRFVGVPAVALAGLGQAYMWTLGPHGMMQPIPACSADRTCVVVVGLDNDVYYGVDEVVGVDMADNVTERLVNELQQIAPNAQVVKYPREIELPPAGTGRDGEVAEAVREARTIGAELNARFVVIGRALDDEDVALRFIDVSSGQEVATGNYAMRSRDSLDQLGEQVGALLGVAPAPPETLDPEGKPQEDTTQIAFGPEPGATPPPPTPNVVVPPRVGQWPTAADFDRAYPDRARERGRTGRAVLRCQVTTQQRAENCVVLNETPSGWGFGDAALRLANRTEVYPQLVDGQPTNEGVLDIPYVFRLREGR